MHNSKTIGHTNVLHIKQLLQLYYRRCFFSRLELHMSYDWLVMVPNTHHGLFPTCYFVHTYTHILKTTQHTRTFYILKDCSTIGDIPFVVKSCMRGLARELQPQTCIKVILWYILCILQAYIKKYGGYLQSHFAISGNNHQTTSKHPSHFGATTKGFPFTTINCLSSLENLRDLLARAELTSNTHRAAGNYM